MRAIYIEKFGGPEVLQIGDRPKPEPGVGEVLVKVHAASINPRDWLLQAGKYQFKSMLGPFPIVLGSDFSGVVEAVGPGTSHFKSGDAVFGMQSRMGAFAEWIVVPEELLAAKPSGVTHADAAAIPCAGLTAYQALTNIGKLSKDGSIVINGAAGGVGTYAIQIAKILGANVTAVASQANLVRCRELGADAVIDYAADDFTKIVREQDVVFDAAGRSSFERSARVLKRRGRYISTVPSAKVSAAVVSTAIRTLGGVLPGPRAHAVFVRGRSADLSVIAGWTADRRIRSAVAGIYPFGDAAKAFEQSRTWHTPGKLVLEFVAS